MGWRQLARGFLDGMGFHQAGLRLELNSRVAAQLYLAIGDYFVERRRLHEYEPNEANLSEAVLLGPDDADGIRHWRSLSLSDQERCALQDARKLVKMVKRSRNEANWDLVLAMSHDILTRTQGLRRLVQEHEQA